MTVACYVRVSSRRQKDDSQRAEIEKWLHANAIDPKLVEWYADKDTGTTLQRPAFDRLQADIFHGKVKTVVLWKLDRLSRRLRDGVTILADWAERGLRVVVVTQALDFNGAIGRTLAALLLGLAEIEWKTARRGRRRASLSPKTMALTKAGPEAPPKASPSGRKNSRPKGSEPRRSPRRSASISERCSAISGATNRLPGTRTLHKSHR
jgi:DNA invertase Pin-like site-specific DNA recombinase